MKITKAIITAAGPGQNALPLQRLVDRDGQEKTALAMIIEEVDAAGIQQVGLVIRPQDEEAYRSAAGAYLDRICFCHQPEPRGYADALLCAKGFANREPTLHLVGDHLYLSRTDRRCAAQLIEVAHAEQCSVSAVQATRETMLPYFGAIGGSRLPQRDHLYEVKRVLEKPTPTQAEQELTVAGFRSGYYLCFFGMHVLTPSVMDLLSEWVTRSARPIPLAAALNELAGRERYLAYEIQGNRYNMGVKYGWLSTQLAFSLAGVDRDQILRDLVEMLASQGTRNAS